VTALTVSSAIYIQQRQTLILAYRVNVKNVLFQLFQFRAKIQTLLAAPNLVWLMATPEMIFADFGRTYFNLDFSAFHISALA